MSDRVGSEEQRLYKSYEEYLNHFYGASAGQGSTRQSLEVSFGKRLARRVLEVEATEKTKKRTNPTPA